MENKDIDYSSLDYSLFKNSYKRSISEGPEADKLKAQADQVGAQAAKESINNYKRELQNLTKERAATKDPARTKVLDLKIKQQQLLIKKAEAEQAGK